MKKKFVSGKLLVLVIMLPSILIAQDLPKVIPPSPETSALFRFQDYPMDYSTGLPQIGIPIYEVNSGSLSVPISISYHASGRRVMDEDGPVSLGWALNAGGSISRTVYGNADFGTPSLGTYLFPSPFKVTGLSNNTDLQYLEKIMHYDNPDAYILPWTESEYDVFSYSFGNAGGKFVFKDANNVKTPVLLPYKPYIITPYYTSRGITSIDILDDKGTLYQFIGTETSGPDNDYAVTSFSLTRIISADKTDTIAFQYTGFAKWTKSFSQQRTYITDWAFDEPAPFPDVTDNESTSQGVYQVQRLKEINFKQGKVLFNLVAGSDKIDNIQVLNLDNQVIKTIQLKRTVLDYLNQGGTSLNPNIGQVNNKLDSVIFKDTNGVMVEKYSMEYFPTIYYGSENAINVHYSDYWGYYNASGMDNMIPRYTLPGGIGIGGFDFNRLPNLNAVKSGVLKKITYPTGGSTSFTYETNKYVDPSSALIVDGPGLRIAQVVTTDNNGSTINKTYKYGIGESGYGFLDRKPDMNTMASYKQHVELGYAGYSPGSFGGSYSQYTFYSGFTPALSVLGSRPIIYTEVAEYHGTPTNNVGKTIYTYDNYAWAPAGMPMFPPSHPVANMHVSNWNFWNNPSLQAKADFKSTLTGANLIYTPKKSIINNYVITNLDDVVGLHVQRVIDLPQVGISASPCNCTAEVYMTTYNGANIYTFSDYHIPVGVKNLSSSTETIYNDDGSTISNTTTYSYNSRQYVSQTSQTGSDNLSIVNNIKFPFDYPADPLLTQMTTPALNMQNYPVEQSVLKNSLPVSSVRTNYFNWGTSPARIAPQTVEVKVGSGNYETRLRYSAYDTDGNPLTVSKESDQLISYIWGYNNTYPIAEVTNTAVKNVFHTSFEDANGNSTLNDSKTGRRSRTGGYSKPLANLDNGSYILSYWQKSGSNWLLLTSSVSVTTGAYTITLTGQVDEVKFYPKASQMKTYTYDPLIGIITQCDSSDHISYYEYDAYGRLKLIRDMNGNILKTFKYQYQGTTSN